MQQQIYIYSKKILSAINGLQGQYIMKTAKKAVLALQYLLFIKGNQSEERRKR